MEEEVSIDDLSPDRFEAAMREVGNQPDHIPNKSRK
jgi:hypothetical protein